MLNKQFKTEKELQILDAVEMLRQMQGSFTPQIMYLAKSHALLSRRLDMEDYFHPSWLEGYDQLMELLHSLTLIYQEGAEKLSDQQLREEMKRMEGGPGPVHVDICYRMGTNDLQAVHRLVQEITSITGMEPHRIYDSTGNPVELE